MGRFLRVRNGRIKIGRLAVAALFCTIFDTIYVIVVQGGKVSPLLFFGITVAELLSAARIAYGRMNIVCNGLLLFVVTALLSGIFQVLPISNFGLFCVFGTVLLPFLDAGISLLFREKQTRKLLYEVSLYQDNEEKHFQAFMDTGNRLKLYGYRIPVVLVDEQYLTSWIRAAEQRMPQKLVFLPFKGVGGKGILHGVRLRCVLTLEDGGTADGEVAAVAAEHRLFHGCTYQMILQPEVLSMVCVRNAQEGEKNVV